jgi:hypothetical protein
MKTIIIYRKDGSIRVMKVSSSSNFQHLGRDLDGDNFSRQEIL